MCEYCGCRGVPPIAELMDEHTALLDDAHHVRKALTSGDLSTALALLTELVSHLDRHVRREEVGNFPVSVVTLGASGWEIVDQAHTESPSFLDERPPP